eukprot:gene9068-1628_t
MRHPGCYGFGAVVAAVTTLGGTRGANCTFKPNTDYDEGNTRWPHPAAKDAQDCCDLCTAAGASACTVAPPPPPPPRPIYNVTVISVSDTPVVSVQNPRGKGYSPYGFTYNPSWLEPSTGTGGVSGLLLRMQNCSNIHQHCNGEGVTGFAPCDLESGICGDLWTNFTIAGSDPRVVYHNGGPAPLAFSLQRAPYVHTTATFLYPAVAVGTRISPLCALQDALRFVGTYYNWHEEGGGVGLSTSTTPLDPSSWTDHGRKLGSRNGCLLARDRPPHYLLNGMASSVSLYESQNLLNWSLANRLPPPCRAVLPPLSDCSTTWGSIAVPSTETATVLVAKLPNRPSITMCLPRSDPTAHCLTPSSFYTHRPGWESHDMEASTPPVRLDSGDYIHFYAGCNVSWNALPRVCAGEASTGQYMVGYIIMSGDDPTQIIQRSPFDTPMMAPLGAFGRQWEVGTQPWPCNTGNVIFLPTAAKMSAPGLIRVWFGAADAVTGTGVIEVAKY